MRELETPSAEIAAGEDIATIVAAHAKDGAGRLAVIEGYRRVDWREHGARIHQLANALSDIGKVLKRELRAPYWCGRDD